MNEDYVIIAPSSNDETIDNPQEYEGPVKALLRLTETAGLLRSTDGCFYAQVSVGGRRDIYPLRSAAFRHWLIDGYLRACRGVPSDTSMADFAVFAEAVGRKLGWPAGTVLSVYNDNRCEAAVTHIDESPVASFLLEWAHELNDWSGTPTELLAQLNTLVEKKVRALRQWPKAPSTLAKELRRIAPHLRLHGISVVFEKKPQTRMITLTKTGRPKNQPSRLSNNLIGRCFPDTFDEEKITST